MVCIAPSTVVDLGVRMKVLNHALGDQQQRAHHRERQQDIDGARVKSTQKLPMVLAEWRAKPRTNAMATPMPAAADAEVMDRQRDHLAEIAHGGFRNVALPVGIGAETDGGIERQVGSHIGQALRIQRQPLLQAQQQVAEQQRPPG